MKQIQFVLLSILMAGCATKSSLEPLTWSDSVSCVDIDLSVRADMAYRWFYSYPERNDQDSIAVWLLTPDLFEKELPDSSIIIFDKASDNRAILMTIPGGGRYLTGTSYVLYQKDDGTTTTKLVADVEPCEEGGVDMPARFSKIEVTNEGYTIYGRFSFCDIDNNEVYEDEKFISREFLEEK